MVSKIQSKADCKSRFALFRPAVPVNLFKEESVKRLTIFSFALALAACASTNDSEFEISEAVVSNVEVEETHELARRHHELQVSFNYSISGFHADHDLYHCSVQFVNADGTSSMTIATRPFPCELEQATGSVSVSWPTPLDQRFNLPEQDLSRIKYPIEYFVAIHQKTGRQTSRVIGQSELIKSTVDI